MGAKETVWQVLSRINCNDKIEKRDGFTYLSWAWAWGIVKEHYPSANYKVIIYEGKPYLYDKSLGYMVSTEVTIEGESIPMQLPVMDSKNKAQKDEPYEYTTKFGTKRVDAATMFDVNTAIMRCLTKNLAMFGLGHYIYAGEDIPNGYEEPKEADKVTAPNIKKAPNELIESVTRALSVINNLDEFEIFSESEDYKVAKTYPELKAVLVAKYNKLKA